MELFISTNTEESKLSLAVEVFTNYVRATQRKVVNVVALPKSTQQTLKMHDLPLLLKPASGTSQEGASDEPLQTVNPFGIMQEIAKAVYLEEILFGKYNSPQRLEILSFCEMAIRLSPEELTATLNTHLETRMFLVGPSITVADIVALTHLLPLWVGLPDFEKLASPHTFRWIDHVQHLPGLLEQVQARSLFVSFPDENAQAPSKSQLKKLQKKGGTGPPAGIPDKKVAKEEVKEGAPVVSEAGASAAPTTTAAPTAPAEEKKPKQKQQQNPPKKPAAAAKKVDDGPVLPDLSYMDIRVGKIVEVHKNPNSEKLYNEKIDIGNGEIRCIASGLQKLIPIEQMEGAMCIVLCNLKARKLADWMSHGMVLCAETADRLTAELLQPPAGAAPGDLITFAGYERKPPAELNAKKNPWDNVAPKLKIDGNGVAVFENLPFTVEGKGVVKSKSITHGEIH